MNAVKELRELIDKANITDTRKRWLDIEVSNMAAAVESFSAIEKDALEDMKASTDPTMKTVSLMIKLKHTVITKIREQVEAEDSAKEAKNIINQN